MKTTESENKKILLATDFVNYTDKHLFLTGKAGTGKTTFLRQLAQNTYKRMVIVAPTGVAAINAGGVTIHSFFQLPFGPQIPEQANQNLFEDIDHQKAKTLAAHLQRFTNEKIRIIKSIDLLVIDEISMVRADLLDAIDAVLRRFRNRDKPFGGVQLLLIGDLQQLAPIAKPDEWDLLKPYYKSIYFFDSLALKRTSFVYVELEHVYRQQDMTFIELLNKIRTNHVDSICLEKLNSRYIVDFSPDDAEGYITLTTHNYQADAINNKKLSENKNKKYSFEAKISGEFPEMAYPTKEILELKTGAQVMFIKNDTSHEKAFYNGKIGQITAVNTEENTIEVACKEEIINVRPQQWSNCKYTLDEKTGEIKETILGSFEQFPLRLAWAITIHKSQGLTFDKVIIDANMAFAPGQVYVALSRCTTFEGLILRSKLNYSGIQSDAQIKTFSEQQQEPDNKTLEQSKSEYELLLLNEMFDFGILKTAIEQMMRIVNNNPSCFDAETSKKLNEVRTRLTEEIVVIGTRFYKQLVSLYQPEITLSENEILQERIKKSSAYFEEKTEAILQIDNFLLETDNKQVEKSLSRIIEIFSEELRVKTVCIKSCKNGFSVQEYLHTKALAYVHRAEKMKSKSDKNNKILSQLLRWREEKMAGLEASASQVASLKSLRAIAKQLPKTKKELKTIPGFGKKRIDVFGGEIIELICKYLGIDSFEKTENDADDAAEEKPEKKLSASLEMTYNLCQENFPISEIAKQRGLASSTIEGHVVQLIKKNLLHAMDFVSKEKFALISDYFLELREARLGIAKEVLGDEISYFELKVVLQELIRNGSLTIE
ncbi:MAG: AAA family ATPase [Lentimicrobiaceae bacterium]|jgi:ATP-dependent exoDNAse (exonuclease V) alpha subunit|nr:AAA family ATPase [Lentimicrobiaceae bacterium]